MANRKVKRYVALKPGVDGNGTKREAGEEFVSPELPKTKGKDPWFKEKKAAKKKDTNTTKDGDTKKDGDDNA